MLYEIQFCENAFQKMIRLIDKKDFIDLGQADELIVWEKASLVRLG